MFVFNIEIHIKLEKKIKIKSSIRVGNNVIIYFFLIMEKYEFLLDFGPKNTHSSIFLLNHNRYFILLQCIGRVNFSILLIGKKIVLIVRARQAIVKITKMFVQ